MSILAEYKNHLYWKKIFLTRATYTAFLSALGFFFLVGKIVNLLFSPGETANYILWCVFILLIAGYTFWCRRPKLKLSEKIANSDIVVEISVCDFFEIEDVAYIIPSNTSFDTSFNDGLISKKSIQGQFTTKYYEGRESALDAEISKAIQGYTIASSRGFDQAYRKNDFYDFGTVAAVNSNGKQAYFFAMAELNESGVTRTTYDDLKKSLDGLWEYISTKGQLLSLAIPVVGSGHGRLVEDKYTIISMIISSFASASKKKKFTDKLTISIYPKDYYRDRIDLSEIHLNMQCMCKNKL